MRQRECEGETDRERVRQTGRDQVIYSETFPSEFYDRLYKKLLHKAKSMWTR